MIEPDENMLALVECALSDDPSIVNVIRELRTEYGIRTLAASGHATFCVRVLRDSGNEAAKRGLMAWSKY